MFKTTHQLAKIRLQLRQVIIAVAALLIFIAASGSSAAQSKERNHPTPLKSNELSADFSQNDSEYFYSFTAGPGEVIFTLDVKGSYPSGGIPYFHLFNTAGRELGSFEQIAARNSSEKLVKKISFTKRQPVVMRIGKPIGGGSYRLRISGAVALESGAETGGDRLMGLPASGTLRFEMKDGSAQELDLGRVRRVTVKP
jgi:hypothetical protein